MTISPTISANYLSPLWQGTKAATKHFASFVIGTEETQVFGKTLEEAVRGTKDAAGTYQGDGIGFHNFGASVKSAWTASKNKMNDVSLWQGIKNTFSKIGTELGTLKSKGDFLTKAKGAFGALGKGMPLFLNLAFLAMEIPNIYTAFTSPKGGIGAGLKEVCRAAIKIGANALGMALGSALGPVGAIAGAFVFGNFAGWMLGKSFTEQQEEEKAKLPQGTPQQDLNPTAQAQAQTATTQNAIAPASNNNLAYNNSANPFASQNYMDRDIMAMSAGLG